MVILTNQQEIGLKNNQSVLDLACGKGRHSIFLNELGYDVTGVDLSNKNIDDLTVTQAVSFTGFTREQLHKLKRHLRIPFEMVSSRQYRFEGEEAFRHYLY